MLVEQRSGYAALLERLPIRSDPSDDFVSASRELGEMRLHRARGDRRGGRIRRRHQPDRHLDPFRPQLLDQSELVGQVFFRQVGDCDAEAACRASARGGVVKPSAQTRQLDRAPGQDPGGGGCR